MRILKDDFIACILSFIVYKIMMLSFFSLFFSGARVTVHTNNKILIVILSHYCNVLIIFGISQPSTEVGI